jgi:hypothetical protein
LLAISRGIHRDKPGGVLAAISDGFTIPSGW